MASGPYVTAWWVMVFSLSSLNDSEGDRSLLDELQNSEDSKSQKVYGKKVA